MIKWFILWVFIISGQQFETKLGPYESLEKCNLAMEDIANNIMIRRPNVSYMTCDKEDFA